VGVAVLAAVFVVVSDAGVVRVCVAVLVIAAVPVRVGWVAAAVVEAVTGGVPVQEAVTVAEDV